jgi:hypothetical protein
MLSNKHISVQLVASIYHEDESLIFNPKLHHFPLLSASNIPGKKHEQTAFYYFSLE